MAWVLVENTKVSVLFYVIPFKTGHWHEAKLHYMLYDTTLLLSNYKSIFKATSLLAVQQVAYILAINRDTLSDYMTDQLPKRPWWDKIQLKNTVL